MSVAPRSLAVVHRRVEPADSLDFFPTAPWACRALFHHVLGTKGFRDQVVEEPACGEGHMAYALEDFFGTVRASDIHPYGYGEVRDFLEPDAVADIEAPDWIITNPPFAEKSLAFMRRALARRPRRGIALFLRTTAIDTVNRWRFVFRPHPPAVVAQFVERVPIHKGRWLPDGDTQTAYLWIVWRMDRPVKRTELVWIPPVCRKTLLFQRDIDRFGPAGAGVEAAP